MIFTEPTMHVISSSELAVSRSPEELEGRPIQSAILLCRLHSPSYPLFASLASINPRQESRRHPRRQVDSRFVTKNPNHERFDDAS